MLDVDVIVLMYKGVICFKVSHTTMGNLQYRSHVWISRQLCQDSVIPQNICPPVPLFTCMMNQQASWDRYVIYMTWLDQQFPSQGCIVYLSRLDVLTSILSRAISIVSCRKNNQQPMSIPQSQDR